MITVRFPTGFSIQYNDATNVTRDASGYTRILTKGAKLIAQVPTSQCVVEFITPCRMYNPLADANDDAANEIRLLRKEITSLKRKLVKP